MIKVSLTSGDFIDRYTIAKIKFEKGKMKKVQRDYFEQVHERFLKTNVNTQSGPFVVKFMELSEKLQNANKVLWSIEDTIREELSKNSPNLSIVKMLSENIITNNDDRCRIKKELDLLFNDQPDSKVYAGERGYDI